MAQGNILPYENSNASSMNGALKYRVAAGTVASINAGEPVQKLAGAAGVARMLTNSPTTTNRQVGIAMSVSTETASADGLVDVIPSATGQMWIIAPKVPATYFGAAGNSQATYNALIGSRVLIDLTAGVYTLLAADAAGNGCVVEYIDVSRYPGMVAFSFSTLTDYRNV
jgi:hypothetical protein